MLWGGGVGGEGRETSNLFSHVSTFPIKIKGRGVGGAGGGGVGGERKNPSPRVGEGHQKASEEMKTQGKKNKIKEENGYGFPVRRTRSGDHLAAAMGTEKEGGWDGMEGGELTRRDGGSRGGFGRRTDPRLWAHRAAPTVGPLRSPRGPNGAP